MRRLTIEFGSFRYVFRAWSPDFVLEMQFMSWADSFTSFREGIGMRDLHELPKLRDSLSYLYVEHAVLNQKQKAIELYREEGTARVPIADISVLFLGPGTSITHAAVKAWRTTDAVLCGWGKT